jgi:hypothetical protein
MKKHIIATNFVLFSNFFFEKTKTRNNFAVNKFLSFVFSFRPIFPIFLNFSKDVSLSNHWLIRFRMSADPKVPHEYRNPMSTDWDCFWVWWLGWWWGGDILTEYNIENSVNVLHSKIIAFYETACPLKRARPGQSTPY